MSKIAALHPFTLRISKSSKSNFTKNPTYENFGHLNQSLIPLYLFENVFRQQHEQK